MLLFFRSIIKSVICIIAPIFFFTNFSQADDRKEMVIIRDIMVNLSDQNPIEVGQKININWEFAQDGKLKAAVPLLFQVEVIEIRKLEENRDGASMIMLSFKSTKKQKEYFDVAKSHGIFKVAASGQSMNAENLDKAPLIIDLEKKKQILGNEECRNLIEEFKKIMSIEENNCKKNEDCNEFSIYFCPLGCLEILSESKMRKLKPLLDKIVEGCEQECNYECTYPGLGLKAGKYYFNNENILSKPVCNANGKCEFN